MELVPKKGIKSATLFTLTRDKFKKERLETKKFNIYIYIKERERIWWALSCDLAVF